MKLLLGAAIVLTFYWLLGMAFMALFHAPAWAAVIAIILAQLLVSLLLAAAEARSIYS